MKALAAFFVVYAGFLLTALSMARHRKQLLPPIRTIGKTTFWMLRFTGWVILLIGMILCIQRYGSGVGLTLWTGLLTAAALLVSMLALYAPRLALALLPCAFLPFVLW